MKPIRWGFGFGASSSGTTLTIGLPALAMMKLSPFAAFSTRREGCVFALWMLIFSKMNPMNLVHLV